MKRSGIIILALSAAFTVLAVALGGRFRLFLNLQSYFLIGLFAILVVAYLSTRGEVAAASKRDRFCLHFVQGLAACVVCIGLLVTLIGLAYAVSCLRLLKTGVGDLVVSMLPLLYCLVIAEIICPVLCKYFGCRVERAEKQEPDAEPNETA